MEIILNTYGVSLNRDNEAFIITIKGEKKRVPTTGIKSIQVGKGAQITSDAIMLAIENEIEIVFMDKGGNPMGRVWSPKYGSISTIRKGQLNFTFTADAIEWIKEVICRKFRFTLTMPLIISPRSSSPSDDAWNFSRKISPRSAPRKGALRRLNMLKAGWIKGLRSIRERPVPAGGSSADGAASRRIPAAR